jgi:hypothetical protein
MHQDSITGAVVANGLDALKGIVSCACALTNTGDAAFSIG